AGSDARQPLGALLVAAHFGDQRAGDRVAEEGNRCTGVAELLAEGRQLDHSETLATVLLGKRDPGPAEVAELFPQLVVALARLGQLAHPRRLCALGEQVARSVLDLALFV